MNSKLRHARLLVGLALLAFSVTGCGHYKSVRVSELSAAMAAYERERGIAKERIARDSSAVEAEVRKQLARITLTTDQATSILQERNQQTDETTGEETTAEPVPPQPTEAANELAEAISDAYFDQQFREYYQELRKENRTEEGWLTRTAAAIVFVPELQVAQPALIQSFSIRNVLQALHPSWDPVDQRNWTVRALNSGILSSDPDITMVCKPDDQEVWSDFEKLTATDKTAFDFIVDHIVDDRMARNWALVNNDILSWDIGLTTEPIGGPSDEFERKVDPNLPQFLFGGGIHFRNFELSVGTMLFRSVDSDEDFRTRIYFSISVDLFSRTFGAPDA